MNPLDLYELDQKSWAFKNLIGQSSPAPGEIGEVIQSVVSTAANTAATGTFGNVTSIALTAGDWDITGQVEMQLNGATMTTVFVAAISINSGNTTTDHIEGDNVTRNLPPSALGSVCTSVATRLLLAASTTVYLKALASFSAGQPQALGTIRARRAVQI